VVPGNDDAMRAIQLYASGIADSVLEGRSSAPALAVSEDEFVELDEQGNPKQKPARGAARPKREAPVRARRSVAPAAPARRRPAPAAAPAAPADPVVEGDEADVGDAAADGEVAPVASASAPRRRTGPAAVAPRRRG
ncbi:MAG: hypothetical protein ACKO7G_07855, partial [Gammaproteobacteria bacterium]